MSVLSVASLKKRYKSRLVVQDVSLDVASGETRVAYAAPKGRATYQPRWSPDGRHLVMEYPHGCCAVARRVLTGHPIRPIQRAYLTDPGRVHRSGA